MKKISVITISFNSAATIRETIESVLGQNYPALEYIIMDGGSTDGTMDIVREYGDRIAVAVSEKDHGISDAFNKGIRAATGEIVGIINSDDLLYPGALQAVSDAFEANPEADIAHGDMLRFQDGDTKGRLVRPDPDVSKLKSSFLLNHPSVYVRRTAYERWGTFNCDYKNAMDYELLSRMYFAGAKFVYVPKVLSCFRMGGVSESADKRTRQEHKRVARRNGTSAFRAWWTEASTAARLRAIRLAKKVGLYDAARAAVMHPEYRNLDGSDTEA